MPGPPDHVTERFKLGTGNRRQLRRESNEPNSYYIEETDENGSVVPQRYVSKLNRPEIVDLFLKAMEQPGPDPQGWQRVP
jgi:hypothetical protein